MRQAIIALFIACLASSSGFAQEHYAYPLNNATYGEFEGMLQQPGEQFHTSVRPYRIHELNESIPFDSLRSVRYQPGKFARTWVGRKMVMESLLKLDSSKFQVFFDPVFHMDFGSDLAGDVNHIVNTRGFVVKGSIGRKLSFYTAFWENQATFMPYMTDWIERNKAIPGQGFLKDFEFGGIYQTLGIQTKGYDYLTAAGVVSFTPIKAFNVQIGNDKHFIGEGYRSLLLSDAPFNYPFLKLTTKWRGLQYMHLLTQLQDLRHPTPYETGFKKKWATFHYFSANIGKRVQVGLFEGIIFNTSDTGSGNGGFDWNFINPLMMIRPVQFEIQQSDQNVVVGLNLKVIPFKGAAFYGQMAFDDLNFKKLNEAGYIEQKLGWQLGFKAFDLFKVKNLNIQLEYNAVRPYTFASTAPLNSYMHYGQSLGHPLGANFHEGMGMISYRYHDFRVELRTTYAIVGKDTTGTNFGNDTYMSTLTAANGPESGGNSIGQGIKTHLLYQNAEIAYTINRASNFTLRLGVVHRYQSNILGDERNLMVYFGVRTDIRNLYYDF